MTTSTIKTLPGTSFVAFVAPLNASFGWRRVCVGTETRKEPVIPMKIVVVFVEAFTSHLTFLRLDPQRGILNRFFFNVKQLEKAEIKKKKKNGVFVTTASEPACVKTPSWREAARTQRSLP